MSVNNIQNLFLLLFTSKIENTMEQLNVYNKLFTVQEANYLIKRFGGHGGSLASIFEDMQTSYTINEASDMVLQKLNEQLKDKMTNPKHPVWYQICVSNGKVPWYNITNIKNNKKIIYKMLKTGYLYLDEYKNLNVANPSVLEYICMNSKKAKFSTPKPKPKKNKKKVIESIANVTLIEKEENETLPVYSSLFINETKTNQTINETMKANEIVDIESINNANITINLNITNINETNNLKITNINEKNSLNITNINEKNSLIITSINETNNLIITNINETANITNVYEDNNAKKNETVVNTTQKSISKPTKKTHAFWFF